MSYAKFLYLGLMDQINNAQLNFSPESLQVLNIVLGFIMFGIALELKLSDFKLIFSTPKAILIGLTSQLILLPLLTFLLIYVLQMGNAVVPSVALGMMLVAACPGGNMSNFISVLAKGNVALSVSMTAIVTIGAVLMTPLNFTFWGGMNPETAVLLESINIGFLDMFKIVSLLLGLPLALGMWFNYKFPDTTALLIRPIKTLSVICFLVFLVGAFVANFDAFVDYIGAIAWIVFLHNALGLFGAYWYARGLGLKKKEARSVSIETGVQNSGLALVLIFAFFVDSPALGGMAVIAGWWGVWNMIAGLCLAWYWSKKAV